jgi:hypothetical protein
VPLSLFRGPSRLSSLREVAIVLCRRDCSQHIPSQGTAHDDRGQLGPATDPGRCGRIWCEFLTARATPYTATCWPASPIADESRRIQGPTRVGPNGRDLKLPAGNSDRTTGPKLTSSRLLSVLSGSTAPSGAPTIPLTWAEGRATVGTDLSAVPGAKTEWGGTMPPSAIRDWHQSAKSPPSRSGAPGALRRPPVPGTPRTSSACSACAT